MEFLEEEDDDVMEDDVISLPAGHRRGSPLKNGDNCRWRGEGSGDEGQAAAGMKRKAERRLEQGAEKKRRQNEREPGTLLGGKVRVLFFISVDEC